MVNYTMISIIAMVLFYQFGDIAIIEYVANHPSEWMYNIFYYLTYLGDGWFVFILGIALMAVNKSMAKAILYSFALSSILATILKYVFARARPVEYFNSHGYGFEFLTIDLDWNSFPSGHSTTIFALFYLVALYYPRYKIPILAFASVAALSRVVLLKHYPSDVVAGALLGVLCAYFVYQRLKVKQSVE